MRDAFYRHLADPGPDAWAAICRLLDEAPDPQRAAEAADLRRELRTWPGEVERRPPVWGRNWAGEPALLALCRSVREVDLYQAYIEAARDAESLRLSDGAPAVRLQRQFTGALQGGGGRLHRVGVRGAADLSGSLCLEWEYTDEDWDARSLAYSKGWSLRRLSVALEVEVKRDAGEQKPHQAERMEALRRRGEVYLLVRRTADMVRQLVAERARLLGELA